MNACLLTYQPSPDPDPLQISTSGTPAQGSIDISVSSVGQTIYCRQIIIVVPVGDTVTDAYQEKPTVSVNTPKWVPNGIEENIPATQLGLNVPGTFSKFTFDCREPTDYLITYHLVLTLTGTVNKVPGSFTVHIVETSGTTNDESTFTKKTGDFSLTKALPQFYLKNFVATLVDKPTIPATDFKNGDPIRFQWESNGTHYQLFEKNQSKPVYAGPDKTYTLPNGTSRDTTFILRASTNTAGQGQPQDSKLLYSALTITVSNPDLTPSSVTASGNVAVGGTLNVTGMATMNGGLVAKESAVSMMTGMKVMEPGSYKALTDGFVLGMVSSDESEDDFIRIYGDSSDGVKMEGCGGKSPVYGKSFPRPFLLPVRQGVTYTIKQSSDYQNSATTKFLWIPLGKGLSKIADEDWLA